MSGERSEVGKHRNTQRNTSEYRHTCLALYQAALTSVQIQILQVSQRHICLKLGLKEMGFTWWPKRGTQNSKVTTLLVLKLCWNVLTKQYYSIIMQVYCVFFTNIKAIFHQLSCPILHSSPVMNCFDYLTRIMNKIYGNARTFSLHIIKC